nr:hypothetical protein [uncultured Allomuricauda sp.]
MNQVLKKGFVSPSFTALLTDTGFGLTDGGFGFMVLRQGYGP